MSSTETNDKDKFDWGAYNFNNAGQTWTGTTQPKWKWSFSPDTGLQIWDADPVTGRPHHIEMTGNKFYLLAQGRVYVDPDGHFEILVWEDRGTEEEQEQAVEAVDAWLLKNTGKYADSVSYQDEGGVYQQQDPNNPDMDAIMTAYMGFPVKTKKPGEKTPCVMCGGAGGWMGSELNNDPSYKGDKLDPGTKYLCARCKGSGEEPEEGTEQ